MAEPELVLLSRLFLFLLIGARTAGMLFYLPIIGRGVPPQFRLFITFALACAVFPLLSSTSGTLPDNILMGSLLLIREVGIGLFMSVALLIFLSVMQMAGDLLGRLAGISVSTLFDPASGENVPILSRFLDILGVTVFLLMGGLELFLAGFLDSFQMVPPGILTFSIAEIMDTLICLLQTSVNLLIQLTAPLLVTSLTLYLAIGIMGRAVPQLNIMSIGLSCNILLAFAMLFLCLGTMIRLFHTEMEMALQTIFVTL